MSSFNPFIVSAGRHGPARGRERTKSTDFLMYRLVEADVRRKSKPNKLEFKDLDDELKRLIADFLSNNQIGKRSWDRGHNDGKGGFVSPRFFPGSSARGYRELRSYNYHIGSVENNDPGHVHLIVEGNGGAFGRWYIDPVNV